jgi:CRISPR-associated endonuclease Cas2
VFVISFDLSTIEADVHHPRGARKAYRDIEVALSKYGFERVQWSVYAAKEEDLAKLFSAIDALKSMPWFGLSVKNIRAFRMEQGSDFTAIVKQTTN